MSTKSSPSGEKRRKAEDVRREALEIGRRRLMAGGPDSVTLKTIGTELGMTHANLIHHFGSAEQFRSELEVLLVKDLVVSLTDVVRRFRSGEAGFAEVVDVVFDAYDQKGIGRMIAWGALDGRQSGDEAYQSAVSQLIATLTAGLAGSTETAPDRARFIFWLVSVVALGANLVGPSICGEIGADRAAMRQTLVALLEQLRRG